MSFPRPRATETHHDYLARCLKHEHRTMREVDAWTTDDWTAFQHRVNPSCGPRTDRNFSEDMAIRLGNLTGELRSVS